MLSFPRKWCRRPGSNQFGKTASPLQKPQKLLNLDSIVRYLWCRRHTMELFLGKQLSLNNSVINVTTATDPVNYTPALSHLATGKRRSTTAANTSVSVTKIPMNGNSPRKKYKLEKEPKSTVALVSSNDHSITAILSSSPMTSGLTNHISNPPNDCFIASSTVNTTTTASSCLSLQKNLPPSLLRTLLKSPCGESNGSDLSLTNNSKIIGNDGGYLLSNIDGNNQKRSVALDNNNSQLPPIVTSTDTSLSKDSVHRLLPIFHHPAAYAAGQLAAGYFNVLYHQTALAAAITHTQLLPQTSSSRFSTSDIWQLQSNRRHILPSPPEMVGGNGLVTSNTILSPYSSPLVSTTVANCCILPPMSSPMHPFPIYPRRNLLVHNHFQQYQQSEFDSGGDGCRIDGIKEMTNNIVGLDKDCSSAGKYQIYIVN